MILAPSPWWVTALSLLVAIGYAVLAGASARLSRSWTVTLSGLVWLLHGTTLGLTLLHDPVWLGFATTLSVTAWLILTVYLIETRLYPQLSARWTLAGLGAPAVLLTLVFPGSAHVWSETRWLPVHWVLGVASYGLLGTAVAHAGILQHAERQMRQGQLSGAPSLPLLALERLTFRFVTAAFVLLSLTLLAGWLFSEQLPGAGWRWNHKTLFTLLSWIVLAVLSWGRWQWGWRGRSALRTLYLAAGLLLLGYVGSRFVLEALLHRV